MEVRTEIRKSAKVFCFLCVACVVLSSCSTVGKTLDCTDLWRFDNCIFFDSLDGPAKAKRAGGYSKRSYNEQVSLKVYRFQKIKKPAKTWGNGYARSMHN